MAKPFSVCTEEKRRRRRISSTTTRMDARIDAERLLRAVEVGERAAKEEACDARLPSLSVGERVTG
jgi:hypothetical protein